MYKRRQRWCAAALLLLGAGCTAGSSSAAPTAVATTAATVQATVASGAQGSAQNPGGRLGGGLVNLAPADLARLISTTMGAGIEIAATPPNVGNDQVTQATLTGTDRSGAWGRLDQQARQAFAGAGLQLARQAFPNAQIDLVV